MKFSFRIWRGFFFCLFFAFAGSDSVWSQTNTNRPVIIGNTNLTGRVGESFEYQVLVGGVGREWVGSDTFSNAINPRSWSTLKATNGGLVLNNRQLALSSTSTNPAAPAQGELAWVPPLPLNQSWLAYARVFVSNTLPTINGQNGSVYLELFQSNRPPGSPVFSNASRVGWGRGLDTNLSGNTVFSSFLFNNAPYTTTNFAPGLAPFFTRQNGTASNPSLRASLNFSNLGTSPNPTNRLVYRASTNSLLFDPMTGLPSGTNGPATATATPAIILPSASSWEVSTTVVLDSSLVSEWDVSNPYQGFQIGFCLVKNSNNLTPLQLMRNRVSLDFLWQVGGGVVGRTAFAQGTNNIDTGTPWIVGFEPGLYAIPLKITYDAETRLLSTSYDDPEFGWVETDTELSLDPALDGSLGEAWGFVPGVDTFQLILSADNDFAIVDDGQPVGAGNTIPGQEVPMYFSDLLVSVQPVDAVQAELPDSALWLLLSYDAATRELSQAYADESSENLLTNAVVNLNTWATNPLPQLRLGASAARTNRFPVGTNLSPISISQFTVIPGPGQLAYSILSGPPDLDINPDLGIVTADSLSTVGATNFTVVVSNPSSGLTATQTFRLNIGAAVPQLAITSSNALQYGVSNLNALTVTATNTSQLGTNRITFSVGPALPAGLTFTTNSNSLTIRGTPLVVTAGTNLIVSAATPAGVGTLTSTLAILPAVPRLMLVQNRPDPKYSTSVAAWSNAYWTVRVSNSLGQSAAFPNLITVSNLPDGFNFRSSNTPVASSNQTATNVGIISLATNQATNVGRFTNVVFAVSNVSGSSTLTSTITVLPSVPVLALVTNASGATNSGVGTNIVFAGLTFNSSNANWFQITNSIASEFRTTYSMQGAPRGLIINPSNGIVSGVITQSMDATALFRAQNSSGPSAILAIRISTLPPAPAFTITTNFSRFATATNVLVATITNTNQLGTNLAGVVWSTTATNAGLGTGFTVQTNANRSQFTIRSSTNSTNPGLFTGLTVFAVSRGATGSVTTNLGVLPAAPALGAVTNTNDPIQYGLSIENALMVRVTNLARQNLADFPITFTASNVPSASGWILTTNSTNAWLSNNNPTVATNALVRFIASNAGGSVTNDLILRVLPADPFFTVTQGANRLQYGSAASTNFLTLEMAEPDGQNTNAGQFPIAWSLSTNAPPGVTLRTNLNALTNFLGGTNPTKAGVYSNVLIVASNAAGTYTSSVNLTVFPQLPQFRMINTNRVQIGANSTNALIVQVTNLSPSNSLGLGLDGFELSFSSPDLPAALDFTSTNGGTNAVVGGVPGVATNMTVRIVVTNLAGAVTNTTNLVILPEAPLIGVTSNGTFQYGVTNTNGIVITVTNSAGQNTNDFPITFSSPHLPVGGWNLTRTTGTNGVIGSVNPSAALSNQVTVVVSNAGGTVSTNLQLRVLPALVSFSSSNLPPAWRYGINNTGTLILVAASQNITNYPISYSSSNLPPGLTVTNLGNGNVRITGAGTNAGIFNGVEILASNAAGVSTNILNLTVLPEAPLFSVAVARAQAGSNSPGVLVVTVTNTNANRQNVPDFPIGFAAALPAGLAFTNTNGAGFVAMAGGTPGVATNKTLVVTVTNLGGTSSVTTNLAVLPAVPELGVLTNTSGVIQFGVANTNAIRISVTNLALQNPADFPLTFTASNLPSSWSITNAGGTNGVIRSLNPTQATNVTNLSVTAANAGGSVTTNLTLRILPAIPQVSLVFTNTNNLRFGSNAPGMLVVTVTNTNSGAQNTNDFPDFGFSFSNAPGGLAFTNTNGLFVATAGSTNLTEAYSNTVTLLVTNSGGTHTNTFVLKVLPEAPQLAAATNGTLQFGVSNTSAITVMVTNGAGQNPGAYPLSFSASNLPTGSGWTLTRVAGTNGVIGNANPTLATNVTNLVITVTNEAGSASTNLTLRVLPLAPTNFIYTYGPAATNRFRAGQSSATLRLTIGAGQNTNDFPITFGGSDLPDGLALSTNGLLSGTPSNAITYPSVFTAENAAGLGTNTNSIQVLGGAPEIAGPNLVQFTNLITSNYFRYQVSGRGVGQNWAGRDDFPDDVSLTNNWNTDGQIVPDASLNANTGYLRYTWTNTGALFAYLEWSQPLPADSAWLASATVNFSSGGVISDLAGLGLGAGDYLGGLLAAFRDAADPDNYAASAFFGNDTDLAGYATAVAVTNAETVTSGILTNTSTVSMGWIGLRSTNLSGTNRLLVLGNPGTNSPVWSTNLSLPINAWTNAAGTNSLVLRLSGESQAPINPLYAFEFSEFVIVPLGDLHYSSTNLPAGLTIDPVTGLITGTLPASPLTRTSTVTISNSLGTTNLTIEFDIQ